MIELEAVTKIFNDITAVRNLSFTVREGEIFGLIGTSGCGKTTTLKMINRLEEPSSGSISVDGQSVINQSTEHLRRRIGYVIQNVGLFPHYTVQENIAITPQLLGWDTGRIAPRCEELLNLVGLDPGQFADRRPGALSGGQQQRVGLARALAANPPVILMDEPFGALDPITKEHIQQKFKKLLQEIQKTVVLVTHDVFEAFTLCDRLCLMNEGEARQIGTPRELLFHPTNDFVHSFFDNHRFQLEMMATTIGDILRVTESKLKRHERIPVNKADERRFSVNESFFSVFNRLNADDKRYIVVRDEEKIGDITSDELLEGFQNVRRKLRAELNE